MNIKSLTLKNTLIDDASGESYYDLTAPCFVYDPDLGLKSLHYVMPDQVGRIDKISEIYFGNTEYIDAICVVNNIFNPFSLQEGDILVIPNISRPDQLYQRPQTAARTELPQKPYTINSQISQKDESRLQRLRDKAKGRKSKVATPLPPNMLQNGQNAKTFEDGLIKLGSNLPARNKSNIS